MTKIIATDPYPLVRARGPLGRVARQALCLLALGAMVSACGAKLERSFGPVDGEAGASGTGETGGAAGEAGQAASGGAAGTSSGSGGSTGTSCDEIECSGHGTCNDASGGAACTCDEGYDGDDCGSCATGYQDNDDDGDCEPDCDTTDLVCDSTAVCDDSSGVALCDCGSAMQDNDHDGSCLPDCDAAALGCGANASCDDSSGTATCQCAAGYQDKDGDEDCAPTCATAALSCPVNATCSDVTGLAECVCDTGYSGGNCDICAAGYQDKDSNGSCLPDCSNKTCSNAGTCDDSSGTATCDCNPGATGDDCESCVVGYERNGDSCDWKGVIVNGSFTGATGWDVTGSGSINASGWGELGQSALCFGGSVEQTVMMPAYADSLPLVLKFRARRGSTTASMPSASVFVNGVLHPVRIQSSTQWVDNTVCLGELGYGGAVTVAFAPTSLPLSCNVDAIHFDDVSIDVAASGQCPGPGEVMNGDFIGGDGWIPTGSVNFDGDRAVLTGSPCSSSSIVGLGWFATAATQPHSALAITYSMTGSGSASGVRLGVTFQGQEVTSLPVGASRTVHVCMPLWAQGGVNNIGFSAVVPGGGACADTFTATLDAVAVSWDAACADAPLLDGGFEGPTPSGAPQWTLGLAGNGTPPSVVTNALLAFEGTKYLQLSASYPCSLASARQNGTAPMPGTAGGPALRYNYFLGARSNASFSVCVGGACTPLAVNADWKPGTICIDPYQAGKPVMIEMLADGGGGACASAYAAEQVWFDGLALVLDPSCPSN